MQQRTERRPSRMKRGLVILGALAMAMTMTFVVGAASVETAEARSSTCTSATAPKAHIARDYYKRACGQKWDANSGLHQCNWNSSGWTCKGPRTSGKTCVGHLHANDIHKAKNTYKHICGEKWNANSGKHFCEYVAYGNNSVATHWICWGPSSR